VSIEIPVVNMWCAHTAQPITPIATIEKTMPRYPKIGFFGKVETTWLTMPKAGRIMM